jgi:hypothetical protein
MIAFDFDRAKMRRRLATYSVVLLAGIAFMFFGLSLSHLVGQGWVGWLVLTLIIVVEVHLLDYAVWVGVLGRGLRRKEPALVINETGIIDNASDIAPGQLAWGEIEKMYPCDLNSRLLLNWWTKMPVISKQRGITVILKGGVDLQRCLTGKPKFVQSLTRQWHVSGRGRWLFIPEMALAVTADEAMQRLNDFYTTQVRGPV